jgi:hypothetical protein
VLGRMLTKASKDHRLSPLPQRRQEALNSTSFQSAFDLMATFHPLRIFEGNVIHKR